MKDLTYVTTPGGFTMSVDWSTCSACGSPATHTLVEARNRDGSIKLRSVLCDSCWESTFNVIVEPQYIGTLKDFFPKEPS